MAEIKILFAGGGDERDSRPLDEIFAQWLGKGRLLYLPTALVHPSNIEAGYRWIQNTFSSLGVTKLDAWMELAGKTLGDLDQYEGVYIGGGNTFYLLQQLRAHGLDRALDAYVHQGKPVFGGSAGAIVLSYDITSCAHIDENIIGLSDYSGLDLALGYTIWCHYTPEDFDRVQAYVRRSGIPSIALTEKAGAYRLGDHLFAAGTDPVALFTLKGCNYFAPGDQIH